VYESFAVWFRAAAVVTCPPRRHSWHGAVSCSMLGPARRRACRNRAPPELV